jgi:hypothetical protein
MSVQLKPTEPDNFDEDHVNDCTCRCFDCVEAVEHAREEMVLENRYGDSDDEVSSDVVSSSTGWPAPLTNSVQLHREHDTPSGLSGD